MAEKLGMKRVVSIDEMLSIIGPFNRFQWILDAMFCIMIFPQTLQVLIMYFAALSPTWKCVSNSTICNTTGTFPSDDDRRCNMSRTEWEFTVPKSFSIVTQFELYCEKEWIAPISISFLFLGWGIGAIVLGWVADNFGRKSVLFPSLATLMFIGFVNSFVDNIIIFILCRFFVGFCIPGIVVQMFVLISELVGSKQRPFAGIIIWFFFALALCLLGLQAYLIQEWKKLFIISSAPYFFVLLFYKFVPESVRLLRLKGKIKEMNRVLERIAYWNRKTIPDDVQVSTVDDTKDNKSNPLDIFKPCSVAISSLIQGFAWLVDGMVYYGLSLASDDLGGSLYRNYVLVSAVEFPAVLLACYLCEKFGRKKTVIVPMLLGGIACTLIAFLPPEGNTKIARVCMGMIGKFFISLSFDSIYTWSVELYSTDLRSQGMGFLQVTCRIGAATSPWVAKGLKKFNETVPFITMGVVTLIAGGFLFFLPETKGRAIVERKDPETHKLQTQGHKLKDDIELNKLIT